ncbi:hypothetical protein VNO77_20256 [Canavalia gladiata]|uniref:Uncharacterized protein n=1 Tax=Canavalia gladiata TaxID=3824 RepID=A0AAN9LSG0_CANGL
MLKLEGILSGWEIWSHMLEPFRSSCLRGISVPEIFLSHSRINVYLLHPPTAEDRLSFSRRSAWPLIQQPYINRSSHYADQGGIIFLRLSRPLRDVKVRAYDWGCLSTFTLELMASFLFA